MFTFNMYYNINLTVILFVFLFKIINVNNRVLIAKQEEEMNFLLKNIYITFNF